MIADVAFLRSFYFLRAYKATFTTLLRCSGFFALFHALAALVNESAVFFTNVASVCKVLWVYNYLGLMLTNFNPHGHGSMRENIDVAGAILEKAKFPVLRTRPWCIPCTGKLTYLPNTQWVDACVWQVKCYLWAEIGIVIVTQMLDDQDLLFTAEGAPKLANRLINLVGVLVLLIGVAGFQSLRKILLPLVLPEHHQYVVARSILCVIFFSWVGGLQNLLLLLCGVHQNTTYAVITIEMFIFQIISHKFFVPQFRWCCHAPDFRDEEDARQKLSNYHFLIPVEDMRATVLPHVRGPEQVATDCDLASTKDIERGENEVL